MEAVSVERGEAESFVGPYRILSTLGRGGMGVVYRGEDPRTGERVAVKTVRVPSASLISGIRREIHALSRLRHPGVARIVGEGIHEGLPYYAMELYEGETLRGQLDRLWDRRGEERSRVREIAGTLSDGTVSVSGFLSASSDASGGDAEPSPTRRTMAELGGVLALIRGACAPLAYLHGEGVVHCDLKPANVVVREDGSPVLVDLGVASSAGAGGRDDLGAGAAAGGSLGYMAPEQLRGELVDARADLYALGVILYQALTGRRPFLGATIESLRYQQIAEPPAPPSRHTEGVPPALDELVLRLLATRPEDRIGHAEDVAEALGALGVPAPAYEGAPRPRAYLYRPVLAGRHEALAALDEALDRVKGERRGQRIFVGGESGVGKTRLALEIGSRAARRGITVIVGQCEALGVHGASGSVAPPLHPLRPLLLALADRCRERPERTPSLLGADGKLLAPYAPALLDLPGQREAPDPPPLSPDASRLRLLDALRARVLAFAAEAPLLLVLDDVQWADELSLALLRMLDGDDFASSGVVALCLYRAEEARGELADLVRAAGAQAIALGRLDAEGVARMVSGMLALREAPPALVSFVHERSEGNPFFVAEHLRAAIADGAVVRDGGRFRLRASEDALPARIHAPPSVDELLGRRLSDLDAPGRALASLAAVFGREVDTGLLLAAAGMDEAAGMDAIEQLVSRQILEASGGDRLRFTHDKLREAAYAGTAEGERAALHRRAAEAIDAAGGGEDRHDALAFHYGRAGMRDEALRNAELAGRRAFAAGAYRKAVEHIGAVLEQTSPRAGDLRRGELLYMHGRALHDTGDAGGAARRVHETLETLGVARLPQGRAGWIGLLAREALKQAAYRALPSAWIRASAPRRSAYALSALATRDIEHHYQFDDRQLENVVVMLLGANLAERSGDTSLMRGTRAHLGVAAGFAGAHGLALSYFEAAARCPTRPSDVAYELEHARDEGYFQFALRADWRRARAVLEPLLDRCVALGDGHRTEQTCIALTNLAVLAGDGRGERPALLARASAERHGHWLHAAWAHEYLGCYELLAGDPRAAIAHFETGERYFRDHGGPANLLNASAGIAAGRRLCGDLDGALEELARGRAAAAGRPSVEVWCVTHHQLAPDVYLDAWRRAVDEGQPAGEHAALARAALRAARRSAATFPSLVPTCLRAAGRAAAIEGLHHRALRLFRAGTARACALEMPLEEALCRTYLAEVAVAAPLTERIEGLARAQDIFRALRGERGDHAPELDAARRALARHA